MFPKKLGMGYHNTSHPEFLDDASEHRAKGRAKYNDISKQELAQTVLWSSCQGSQIFSTHTNDEDMNHGSSLEITTDESVLFGNVYCVPMCVNICPNDCLHMTTELRVDVLDNAEGEYGGMALTRSRWLQNSEEVTEDWNPSI